LLVQSQLKLTQTQVLELADSAEAITGGFLLTRPTCLQRHNNRRRWSHSTDWRLPSTSCCDNATKCQLSKNCRKVEVARSQKGC